MKIIFDCGSTKTSVALLDSSHTTAYFDLSAGYNALSGGDEELHELLKASAEIRDTASHIAEVHFYGAGCATSQACTRVTSQLARTYARTRINVESDMLGAARALCQRSPGIVGILGTGSNSCVYDGARITANVSPLGYILGDEGSGAVLGRLFLGRLFKNQFPSQLLQAFEQRFSLTVPDIITAVYRSPRPNAFLASFAPFIAQHASEPEVDSFLHDEFHRYVRFNLMNYPEFSSLPVHFTGSIAQHFAPHIICAVNDCGGCVGRILPAPIRGLADYHSL